MPNVCMHCGSVLAEETCLLCSALEKLTKPDLTQRANVAAILRLLAGAVEEGRTKSLLLSWVEGAEPKVSVIMESALPSVELVRIELSGSKSKEQSDG